MSDERTLDDVVLGGDGIHRFKDAPVEAASPLPDGYVETMAASEGQAEHADTQVETFNIQDDPVVDSSPEVP